MKIANRSFGKNSQKKVLKKKKEHHLQILPIRNSLRAKFQLKLTTLNFWTKLSPKGYFQSKKELNENYHRILQIQISPGSKFDFFKFEQD